MVMQSDFFVQPTPKSRSKTILQRLYDLKIVHMTTSYKKIVEGRIIVATLPILKISYAILLKLM
jgi:hypothetical protein